MQLPLLTYLTLGFVCASATLIYPEAVPVLERRQAPGTPQYDCHANCGGVITAARAANYCTSSNFTTSLSQCLSCAVQYDIWRYYSTAVSGAAAACGLPAVPVNGTSTATGATTIRTAVSTSGSVQATSTIRPSTANTTSSTSGTAAAATSSSMGAKNIFDFGMVAMLGATIVWLGQL